MSLSLFVRRGAILSVLCAIAFAARAGTPADCAAEADRVTRDQGSVAGGAARGAVGGAVFGAIVGGNSRGTGRGAAVGAVVGGARQANRRNYTYQAVYDDCLRRR